MPRYYRRRYTRVVRPKKKWASNIAVWNYETMDNRFATLASNNAQAGTPTPSILKVGNFKVSADIFFQFSSNVSNFSPSSIGYILYVPEGWGLATENFDDLIVKHPEWIMATKTMGGNLTTTATTFYAVDSINMSTRLKRNLNSGDRVVFYIKVASGSTPVSAVYITGNVRYWTCSN